ncbi:LysR family transcriptional regulator [Agrococcus sp. Marseille-P2731]|uniref:LysR family transcriptional regulator n=1 Tax=Agrococcus sp. Marseille-P2731 TaxID=1841862 RepID=UPI0009316B8F|nr:LysR family transcriptional regulator [Agrococcus sp. Marseille-P2731]
MDLHRHLRFFLAVADHRHFGAAAVSLGMTQPPLSQGIQKLERTLGVRLFERDARGVSLTADGSRLEPRARRIIEMAEELVEQAGRLRSRATLRIGMFDDLDPLVDPVLTAVREAGAPCTPTIRGSRELIELVASGQLDIAIVRHPSIIDGTEATAVTSLPMTLTARHPSRLHPLRGLTLPVAVAPRTDHPAAHDQFVDLLRRLGHTGETVEADGLVARRALVSAGIAAGTSLAAHDDEGPQLALRVKAVVPVARSRAIAYEPITSAITRVLEQHALPPRADARS